LYYKGRLFIPSKEELLTKIVKGCHDSKVAGHFGQEKTILLVTRNFLWEQLCEWINYYVRLYNEYQHNKSPRHAKYGLLQPLEVPYSAWTSISVDFFTLLPESQGQTQIRVVVNLLQKWPSLLAQRQMRAQKMSRIPSLKKFENFTKSPPKSSRTWTPSFWANFRNHWPKH